MNSEKTYTITELARRFGITPRTIRFYEDQGLLSPGRAGLNRVYARRDRTRLKLALRGRRLGLSLAQIRELLDMYEGVQDSVPQLQRLLGVLRTRREALEQQREDIAAALDEIAMVERECLDLLRDDPQGAARARQALAARIDDAG